MTSIYLVRSEGKWLFVRPDEAGFAAEVSGAMVYGKPAVAEQAAAMLHAEPVEFREVGGDTAAGALAAAQRLIKRHAAEINRRRGEMAVARELLDELGVPAEIDGVTLGVYQRIKLLAKRDQEATE